MNAQPTLGVTRDLTNEPANKGGRGWAEPAPEVEGERREEVTRRFAEGRVFFRFGFFLVGQSSKHGVRVSIAARSKGVDSTKVNHQRAMGGETRQRNVARAVGASGQGNLFQARDPKGLEHLGERITGVMVMFRGVVEFAAHEVVPEGVHWFLAEGARAGGVAQEEGCPEPPSKEDPVFFRGKGDWEAVVRHHQAPPASKRRCGVDSAVGGDIGHGQWRKRGGIQRRVRTG